MADVFISYSRHDREFVTALDAQLAERSLDVWVDWEDIPPTAKWREEIRDAVSAADAVVFVLTPRSLTSHECGIELDLAFEQNKRVITLMREEPGAESVPERIAALNWIPATPDRDLSAVVETLLEAMRTDLDWVRLHTRLLVRSNEWESRGRDRSYLLGGTDLRAAEAALASAGGKEPQPTDLQREYVAAGRRAAERRQRQLLGGVSVALVVAIGLAIFALVQRNDAIHQKKQALSRELAANAALTEPIDPELSLLLAIRAARTTPTAEAASALRRALVLFPLRATLRPTAYAEHVAFAADGRHAVTVGRTTELWDVTTMRHTLTVHGTVAEHPPAAFTPDVRQVVIGTPAGVANVYDAVSGRKIRPIPAHDGAVDAIAISKDGARVALAGANGMTIAPLTGAGPVVHVASPLRGASSLAFSPDGRTVAAGTDSGGFGVWSAADGARLLQYHAPANRSIRVEFAAGGRLVAADTENGPFTIWDVPARRRVVTAPTASADLSLDGNVIAEKASNNQILIRQRSTGKTTRIDDSNGIYFVRFTPDGRDVLTVDFDLAVRVWRVSDGALAKTLQGVTGGSIVDLAVTPDSSQVIAVSNDGSAHVWRISDPGTILARGVVGLAANPSASALLVRANRSIQVRRFTGSPRTAITPVWLQSGARISDDGRTVAGKDATGAVRVWQVGSSAVPRTLPVADAQSAPVALSPDGRWLASVSSRGELAEWDTRGGRRRVLGNAGRGVDEVSFSPDGTRIATASRGTAAPVRAWRTAGGVPRTIARSTASNPSFSPDGRMVVLTRSAPDLHREGVVRLVPADGGRPAVPPLRAVGIGGARFSPDGRLLATAGLDGLARVWTAKGEPIAALTKHNDYVSDAIFSPTSQYVLTTSNDGSARVWEAVTGQPLLTVPLSFDAEEAAFALGGRAFAAIEPDGSARLFQCEVCRPLPELLKLAESRVTRQLSRAERNRYLRSAVTP